ncbi:hypothetical protein LguiB_012883 [Lonicera macranthoides]
MHPSIQTLIIPCLTNPSIPKGVENIEELPISFIPNIIRALNQLYNPVLQWFKMQPKLPMAILPDNFHGSWTFRLCQQLGIKRINVTPTNGHWLLPSKEVESNSFGVLRNQNMVPTGFEDRVIGKG